MRRPRLVVVVLLSPVALLLAQCSTGTPEAATTRACERAQDLATALASLDETIGEGAPLADVQDAAQRAGDAQDALDDAAGDLARDRVDAVDAAWERVDDGIDALADDAAVTAGADRLQEDVAVVEEARVDLVAELGC
ncbi:hypothetical protein [Cellulomonas sp. KH9]|uniref:hypothetical protein n=1 Tax=Cellulomonas sp. KH9 TaxID=1855324 RepID=UPI0008E61334|nr:hypothetical protein [Cellulomonas sp. KH9]SFK00627.1 hypothetical protein SAMN05216467_1660 [Cellulomonas sp. KH9]